MSKLHRELHFKLIARDIISYIDRPDAVVLDYACGEALSATAVAEHCAMLILAEPAPGVSADMAVLGVGAIVIVGLVALGQHDPRGASHRPKAGLCMARRQHLAGPGSHGG